MAYWAPIGFQGKGGGPIMDWFGSAFTSPFDGLAEVRPAIDSVPGVLTGCKAE
jgi:hypothetical protein